MIDNPDIKFIIENIKFSVISIITLLQYKSETLKAWAENGCPNDRAKVKNIGTKQDIKLDENFNDKMDDFKISSIPDDILTHMNNDTINSIISLW